MMKDLERIKRLSDILGEEGIDYLVVLDEVNIHYLAGGVIDYSLVYLNVKESMVEGIVNIMEAERVKKVTWLDDYYVYVRRKEEGVEEYRMIEATNMYDALSKVVEGKIAVPFDRISHTQYQYLERYFDEIYDASNLLWKSRKIKTSYELKYMEKSGELVDYGIYKAIENLSEGIRERELAELAKCEMFRYGADKVFDFLIVASGLNSSNPHWRASQKKISEGDVVTFDFVASYGGYYGDETRTVFLGHAGDELKKIYEIVLEAQVEAIDAIEPGVKTSYVDEVARDVIDRNGYGKYFIHSTGHGIGLEVHEPPRLSQYDNTKLEEGMVVTVEPGIYVKGLGGVRIEDMVYVSKRGARVLTKLNKAFTVI